MKLNGFYAKDENVMSAVYDSSQGRAEILVDPFLDKDSNRDSSLFSPSLFWSRSLYKYSIPCTLATFNSAFSEIDKKRVTRKKKVC